MLLKVTGAPSVGRGGDGGGSVEGEGHGAARILKRFCCISFVRAFFNQKSQSRHSKFSTSQGFSDCFISFDLKKKCPVKSAALL